MAYDIRSEKRVRTVISKVGSYVHPLDDLQFSLEDADASSFINENEHGCEVLCTPLVILDVDWSDENKDKFVFKDDLERYLLTALPINTQLPWRLYETRGGFRIVLASLAIPPSDDELVKAANCLLVDKRYMKISAGQNMYRARITPKPNRLIPTDIREAKVCKLVMACNWNLVKDEDILTIIADHDQCSVNSGWSEFKYYLA